MPSTYAHYVFGRGVYRKEQGTLKEILQEFLPLYQVGIHGPDVFFYHRPLCSTSMAQIGTKMHQEPGAIFFSHGKEVFVQQKTVKEREQVLAYLLGFLTHFVLDATVHGYVESKMYHSQLSHTEIEVEFDRYLMVERGIDPLRHRLTRHIHPVSQIGEVMEKVHVHFTSEEIVNCLRNMVIFDGIFLVPWNWKRKVVSYGIKMAGKEDILSGQLVNQIPNPLCADSNLRIKKLMKKAYTLYWDLEKRYLLYLADQGPLPEFFGHTFSAPDNWKTIPVLSLSEEMQYTCG